MVDELGSFVFWAADANVDDTMDMQECKTFAEKPQCRPCLQQLYPGMQSSSELCQHLDEKHIGSISLDQFKHELRMLETQKAELVEAAFSNAQAMANNVRSAALLAEIEANSDDRGLP